MIDSKKLNSQAEISTDFDASADVGQARKSPTLEDIYMKDTKTRNTNVLVASFDGDAPPATDSNKYQKTENVQQVRDDVSMDVDDGSEMEAAVSEPKKDPNLFESHSSEKSFAEKLGASGQTFGTNTKATVNYCIAATLLDPEDPDLSEIKRIKIEETGRDGVTTAYATNKQVRYLRQTSNAPSKVDNHFVALEKNMKRKMAAVDDVTPRNRSNASNVAMKVESSEAGARLNNAACAREVRFCEIEKRENLHVRPTVTAPNDLATLPALNNDTTQVGHHSAPPFNIAQ